MIPILTYRVLLLVNESYYLCLLQRMKSKRINACSFVCKVSSLFVLELSLYYNMMYTYVKTEGWSL